MMSDERFTTDYSDLLKNTKTFIKMDNERLTYEEVVDLLNEQQTTIEQLEKDKAILKERLRECAMRLDKYLGNCR